MTPEEALTPSIPWLAGRLPKSRARSIGRLTLTRQTDSQCRHHYSYDGDAQLPRYVSLVLLLLRRNMLPLIANPTFFQKLVDSLLRLPTYAERPLANTASSRSVLVEMTRTVADCLSRCDHLRRRT